MALPGMMIYFADFETVCELLDDAQIGVLMRMLVHRAQGAEPQDAEDVAVKLAYRLLGDKADRDAKRYAEIAERRRDAGRKAADTRWQRMRTHANACERIANDSKRCINVDVPVDVNENVNATVTPTENVTVAGNSLSPIPSLMAEEDEERGTERERYPQVSDILDYARSAGRAVSDQQAAQFVSAQEARGWKDSNDRPIRDWRVWFDGWYARNAGSRPMPAAKPEAGNYEQRTYDQARLDEMWRAAMLDEEVDT